MLNVQVAYLETITGPAMHIFPGRDGLQRRDYLVEGCKVIAHAREPVVIGYSLDLTPKCNFNLSNFMGDRYSTTRGLTVGKFIGGGFGSDMRVQSSCIYLCGNAADLTVDFTFEGPHALKRSLDAAERWAKVMRNKEGDAYVRPEETKLEKLARVSGKATSKGLDALARHGFDLRGKLSAPISRVPRRAPPPEKPKADA